MLQLLGVDNQLGSQLAYKLSFNLLYYIFKKMQQYAGIYLLQNHSLYVSEVHRTYHKENIKL